MRIYNTVKAGDQDGSLNATFHLAGRDAYYRTFGAGAWYGNAVAIAAESTDRRVAVIAWQAGYVRGSDVEVERRIREWIGDDEG